MSNLKLMWRRYNPKENIWKFQSDIPPSGPVETQDCESFNSGRKLLKHSAARLLKSKFGDPVEIQVLRFRVWNPSHQREVASREKGLALIRLQRERKQKTVGDKTICKTICKENLLPQNVCTFICKENKNYLQGNNWGHTFLPQNVCKTFCNLHFVLLELLSLIIWTWSCPVLPLGLCDPARAAPTPIVAISSDRAGRGPSLYLPADTNTPQRHKKGKYPESLPMDCPLPLLAISWQRWVEFYPVVHLLYFHSGPFTWYTVFSLSPSRIALRCSQLWQYIHWALCRPHRSATIQYLLHCSECYAHRMCKCRAYTVLV